VMPEPMAGSACVTATLVRNIAVHEAATRDASNTTNILVMVMPPSRTDETEIYHEGHDECSVAFTRARSARGRRRSARRCEPYFRLRFVHQRRHLVGIDAYHHVAQVILYLGKLVPGAGG